LKEKEIKPYEYWEETYGEKGVGLTRDGWNLMLKEINKMKDWPEEKIDKEIGRHGTNW